ncbi:DUF4347 domain-containing protein [Chlorobaculum sp. 24CR]|uniref:DUF4347 domain-containing protein n=1 Tax=Chlorobaculum sp. 24CR TaxID=2508878 RepID=UPI00100B1EB0|nr:DUF4347 domain-containing protein [Chlorobaculum sp. 24CR]RXK84657.1 DUF4347 domain-containing protein [Chlorobaculum sp. 24CR]
MASIVFLDSRVEQKESLISSFSADTEYYLLNDALDGIGQIADTLAAKSGYSSIHIISHGSPGSITIGSTVLDAATLDSYADALVQIGYAFQAGGDLLLYGCNVGAGDAGQQFVEHLSQLTGLDVAASNDPTGSAAAGGDWELEVQVGAVESADVVSAEYPLLLGNEDGAGLEFHVNTFIWDFQQYSSIAALENGGFIVLWESVYSGGCGSQDGYGIHGQRYNASGATVGGEFKVSSNIIGCEHSPTVASMNDGGFVAVWYGWYSNGSQDDGIILQRFDADGDRVGSVFVANTYTDGAQYNPAITELRDGGFVVTWESSGYYLTDAQDGSGAGIYGQRYDASGNAVGAEFLVPTNTLNAQRNSSITALSDGGFVVVWESVIDGTNYSGIYGQRYTASSEKAGGEFRVDMYVTYDPSELPMLLKPGTVLPPGIGIVTPLDGSLTIFYDYQSILPTVATLSDGGFVVSWAGYNYDIEPELGKGYEVYGRRYDAAGNAVGDAFQVNTYTSGDQTAPSVTELADGGFVITWQSDLQDGSYNGVYGQRFDAAGNRVGTEFHINTYTEWDQTLPVVTGLADGGFVATWDSFNQEDLYYGYNGIYGQRYDAAGNPVALAQTSNEAPTLTYFSGEVETTAENTEVEISFAELMAKGDESDADGTVEGFVVKSVTSGTLRIGADAANATVYDAGANETIDAAHHAYWTPGFDEHGTLEAFSVVALDDVGGESSTAVEVSVDVVSENHAPEVSIPALLSFAPKVDYATGSYPYSVTSADVDGDGDADMLVANYNSNTVSVLLNNGNGTFAVKVDYATGDYPRSVTSADVDGDGDADMLVANGGYSGSVSVLLNNGNGTFAAKVDYATGYNPYSVTSADVDGDGDADLLVANYGSHTVSVLLNNGNGTFAPKVDYATGYKPVFGDECGRGWRWRCRYAGGKR